MTDVIDVSGLLTDLVAEGDDLDAIVSTVDETGWRTETPADGWTVAHQIAHLSQTDRIAVLAATDTAAFAAAVREMMSAGRSAVDKEAAAGAALPPAELLAAWRSSRAQLADALRAVPQGEKLPWFGPPMGAPMMATARLMETWAHGQDVADALGVRRTPTDRLRNVAHIGVRTIGFAFSVHQLDPPATPFRVELTGPDGDPWTWGADDSPNRVAAPALDFCLLVTQRRNPADLRITVTGDQAARWVPIAQAFAGPPGKGRPAGAVS